MSKLHATLSVLLSAIAICLCVPQASASGQARQAAKKGNRLLRANELDGAIQQYEEALAKGYSDPTVLYNKALAHSRQDDVDTARDLFNRVAAASSSPLSAKARYNLGTLDYAQALQAIQQNPDSAVTQLRSAIKHYRSALSIDKSDRDARANIELASRLIRQLREQQEQQQQDQQSNGQQDPNEQQQNDEQQEDDQSQQRESSDGNDSNAEQDEQAKSEQQQSDDDADDSQSPSGQQPEGDEQQEEQSPSAANQEQQSDQQNNRSTAEQSTTDRSNHAKDDEGEKQQSDPKQPEPKDGELKALNESAENDQQRNPPLKEGDTMTMEEAQKMLQAVRDRAFRRQLQKLQEMRSRRIPVEKDW